MSRPATPPVAPRPDLASVPGLPFDVHHVAVDDQVMAYLDVPPAAGAAHPPVVLVHGNPSWSFLWRSLLGPLAADGRRALAPDHVGMGRSSSPSVAAYPYTLARRTRDLGRWFDAVLPADEAPQVDLVVHDWGGATALGWAVQHPDRVRRIVLLNTSAQPLPEGTALPWHLRLTRTWPVGDVLTLRANAFARGATVLGTAHRMDASARAGLLAPYDTPEHRVGVLEFVKDVPDGPGHRSYQDLRRTGDRLHLLADRPVLVCWGTKDPVLDVRVLGQWESTWPQAQVHRFDDAGHYVLEDAADRVVPLVREFLAAGPA